MNWKVETGQHTAKIGPFTLCAYANPPGTPDSDPEKPWIIVVWRSGRTVATSGGLRNDAEARAAVALLLKQHLAGERELFLLVENELKGMA